MLFDIGEVGVDHDIGAVGDGQFMRHIGTDTADAADDVMLVKGTDFFEHFSSPQFDIDFSRHQEHGHLGQHVIDEADAYGGDQYGENPPDRTLRHINYLGVADGRYGDEGHVKAVEQAVLGAAYEAVADSPHRVRQDQCQHRTCEGAIQVVGDAALCRVAEFHRFGASVPRERRRARARHASLT